MTAPNINNTRQEVVRVDYDLSDKWRLTGRYTHDLSETRELQGLFFGTTEHSRHRRHRHRRSGHGRRRSR